jgi:thiol-disulfide isomerase/thioredoxin
MLSKGTRALLAITCLMVGCGLRAGAEHPEGPFLGLSLDQALARAAKEQRVVFIDFYTTWCEPCKKLDLTTWKDAKVVALLGEKTIPLKVDAEREAALSKQYAVNAYPTLLLLRPDGTVLDRLVGYQAPEPFIAALRSALAGKGSLARAQETAADAAKGDPKSQVEARYELARTLAQQGQNAEGLKEFLWLFDEGMKRLPEFTGVRVSFLLSDIERLGRRYLPALEALRQRRDAARASFLAAPEDTESALDFASLNRCLKETQATLETYDKLAPDSPGRKTLGQSVWAELISRRRYTEAVELKPLKLFYQTSSPLESRITNLAPASDLRRALLGAYKASSVLEIEALAGAGSLEDASVLVKKCLSLDDTPETRKLLMEHLARAGHAELLN